MEHLNFNMRTKKKYYGNKENVIGNFDCCVVDTNCPCASQTFFNFVSQESIDICPKVTNKWNYIENRN